MKTMVFSAHVNDVFAKNEIDYAQLKNLMFDLAHNEKIYDEETGRAISKAEANDKLRKIANEIFGLSENSTRRDRNRAFRDHGREFMDLIEEVIDNEITVGLQENDFFQQYVEYRNIAMGDALEFVTEDDTILIVGKVGNSHHDIILQTLGEGESFTVPTERYAVAVGADIDRYLLGQVDWAKLVSKVAEAFAHHILEMVYANIISAANALPAAFKGSGVLVKASFDAIVDNVEALGVTATILGTKPALRKLASIVDVDYIADSQKESVASTGLIGWYDGNGLVRLPNRFADKTLSSKVFNDKMILILPVRGDGKLVAMIDEGETEINEVTDKGEANGRIDDIRKYEAQRVYGAAVKTGKYFGQWILP